jgi:hypothetical protein
MSYRRNAHARGFGQDPLSCLAQGGIPTSDGRCVSTAGKLPEQIQCEVAGGQWWLGVCQMPGQGPPPIVTTGIAAAARAVCAGLGGRYEEATGDCLFPGMQPPPAAPPPGMKPSVASLPWIFWEPEGGRLPKAAVEQMAREQQQGDQTGGLWIWLGLIGAAFGGAYLLTRKR